MPLRRGEGELKNGKWKEKDQKRNVEKSMDGLVELEWRKRIAEDLNEMKNRRC